MNRKVILRSAEFLPISMSFGRYHVSRTAWSIALKEGLVTWVRVAQNKTEEREREMCEYMSNRTANSGTVLWIEGGA
jgi:hypothetical protein